MRYAMLLPVALLGLAGCEQRPPSVYVLESRQSVDLIAAASASHVRQGDNVVLHVERRTYGEWNAISRDQRRSGQCWVYRPPRQVEPEVAHSLQCEVDPDGAVEVRTDYQ